MFEKERKEHLKDMFLSRSNAYAGLTHEEMWQDGAEYEYNKDVFFFLFLAYCLFIPREEFDSIIKSIDEDLRNDN